MKAMVGILTGGGFSVVGNMKARNACKKEKCNIRMLLKSTAFSKKALIVKMLGAESKLILY